MTAPIAEQEVEQDQEPDLAEPETDYGATGLPVVPAVLLTGLVFVRLPLLFAPGSGMTAYAVSLMPFVVAIGWILLGRGWWRVSNATGAVIFYVALLAVASLRGAQTGTLSHNGALFEATQFSLIAALGAFAFLREGSRAAREQYLSALLWAPAVFLAVNVVLHLRHVHPGVPVDEYALPATMLAKLHVTANRVYFPLSGGLNNIGPVAVAAFAIGAILLREHKVRGTMSMLLGLYVMLAIDSRGAVIFALLAVAIVKLIPRAAGRRYGWLALALPVLPIVMTLALTNLAGTGAASELSRTNAESITTGTGRTVVWKAVIDAYSHPKLDHVFGYGRNGQKPSGISRNYAYIFSGDVRQDPLLHSTHNVVLQTLLDTGWVGVIAFVTVVGMTLTRIGRLSYDPWWRALLAGSIAMFLLGVVQADPSPVHPDSLALWVLIALAASRPQFRGPPAMQA